MTESLLDLCNGSILVTKSGRRFAVCKYKRRDDAPDTFRLRSLQIDGCLLSREWTLDDMRREGLTIEERGA